MQDYSSTGPVHKTPHRPIGFVYIIPIGLVVGFLLFAGNHVWQTITHDFSDTRISPTPARQQILQSNDTPTETPSPTPTGEGTVERQDISIQVLNGSGIAGEAGKVADFLKEKGYTEVTTGNADTYDFTDVTIRAGAENKKLAEQIKADLASDYTVVKVETADIKEAVDVVVIIGKSASEEKVDQ